MTWKAQIFSLIGIVLLGAICHFYIEKSRALGKANQQLSQSLSEHIALNAQQQARLQQLAAQDAQHLQALTHAKTEIDRLHTASLAHPERVYIKATCPSPDTAAAPGVADATAARPADTAVRNYWLLRERAATAEQMIVGLQDYITTQCQ
ncbi:lysis system i-spanin subunit Rz [Xenorhabdus cabanillasii]|uniref:Phosphoprotein phosphatase n=1 Tax=Xenorhabdus cabanillasii JM26 TaxID=1427517 RepID=W1IMU3_9GAMM